MANKDITETGVQEVLRTMGIPSSFKGFREDVTGRAEALATVGSGVAGTMAGMGGGLFEMLRSGNPQAALDQYRQIQEAMTFVPRTQKGLENVQDIGEFFEPVANIYERFGEGVAEQTGSPVVGEFAQEFVDPLDLMGLGAVSAIPAIARKSRFAENAASQKTQRLNTVATAIKASKYLDEMGAKGKFLDYGAGFGENAKAIKADETFEPFPQGEFNPTYTDPAQVPANAYGRIISTNVLNVLPPDIRQEAVLTIGKALEPDGTALVQTWDINAAKQGLRSKQAIPVEGEEFAYTTSTGSYQKGFSTQELQEYIAETLGPGFLVEPVPNKAGISGSSVTIKKIADPSIQLDLGVPEAQIDEIAEQVLRLYHASPADFDEFSLDFIGTGEGAQAYGQGLYFAEANKTADYYYEMFNEPRLLVNGVEPNTVWTQGIRERFSDIYDELYDDAAVVDFKDRILSAIEAEEYDIPRVEEKIDDLIDKVLKGTEEPRDFSFIIAPVDEVLQENYGVSINDVYDVAQTQNEMDTVLANLSQANNEQDLANLIESSFTPSEKRLYRRYIEPKIKIEEGGAKMYEVDVKVKDDELLDWDKPLSQQNEAVRKAIIENIPGSVKQRIATAQQSYGKESVKGEQIVQVFLRDELGSPQKVSEFLNSIGIKGITYADGLSRNKEGGTSNFVIFDPRIIKIAKKYGVAIPVAGAILLQIEKELEKQTEQAPVA